MILLSMNNSYDPFVSELYDLGLSLDSAYELKIKRVILLRKKDGQHMIGIFHTEYRSGIFHIEYRSGIFLLRYLKEGKKIVKM